ncbi:MAG: DUF2155 domain-containing protein [Rickettsiaceae bacterium]
MKNFKNPCQLWLINYRVYYFALLIIFIFCNLCTLCLAEDESLEMYSLEEIEKDLLNQSAISEVEKIEREDLQKLEDKKKESISYEVNIPQVEEVFSYKKIAKIIILNKITTKSNLVKFNLGESKFFGNISVEVHKCAKNMNPLKSSNLMLITVVDNKIKDDKILVFHGWMDSSNLSISTLEHPVYEIIPMDCID